MVHFKLTPPSTMQYTAIMQVTEKLTKQLVRSSLILFLSSLFPTPKFCSLRWRHSFEKYAQWRQIMNNTQLFEFTFYSKKTKLSLKKVLCRRNGSSTIDCWGSRFRFESGIFLAMVPWKWQMLVAPIYLLVLTMSPTSSVAESVWQRWRKTSSSPTFWYLHPTQHNTFPFLSGGESTSPRNTISVYGSSCSSLFVGLILSYFLALSASWHPVQALGMQINRMRKQRCQYEDEKERLTWTAVHGNSNIWD